MTIVLSLSPSLREKKIPSWVGARVCSKKYSLMLFFPALSDKNHLVWRFKGTVFQVLLWKFWFSTSRMGSRMIPKMYSRGFLPLNKSEGNFSQCIPRECWFIFSPGNAQWHSKLSFYWSFYSTPIFGMEARGECRGGKGPGLEGQLVDKFPRQGWIKEGMYTWEPCANPAALGWVPKDAVLQNLIASAL